MYYGDMHVLVAVPLYGGFPERQDNIYCLITMPVPS